MKKPASRKRPAPQRAKVSADESLYDEYDNALMLCTAPILSFFPVGQLGMKCRVVVGFDSGDALELGSYHLR